MSNDNEPESKSDPHRTFAGTGAAEGRGKPSTADSEIRRTINEDSELRRQGETLLKLFGSDEGVKFVAETLGLGKAFVRSRFEAMSAALQERASKLAGETLERGEDDGTYFGACPVCGKTDGYLNVGRNHWFVCREHKKKWCAGSNLFSDWRDETEEKHEENAKLLESYETVSPIR